MTMKIQNRIVGLTIALSALLLPNLRADKTEAYKFSKEAAEAAKSGDWNKAIDRFQKAVKADPQDTHNYDNLGLAQKGAGQLDDALKSFSAATDHDANNALAYEHRAGIYISQGNYDKAIEDLDRSIKLADNPVTHRLRAFAYLESKEYPKAIDDYNVVLTAKPNDLEALNRRAFALWNSQQYDKAIADYTKILQAKPQDKDALLGRSYVYELKKDYANSDADCDKVLAIDPTNAEAKTRKARLKYLQQTPTPTPTPPRPRRHMSPA